MPYFWMGGGSCNSHDIILFGMSGMCLLISPRHRTNSANIGIWRGLISMYASMFWVTFVGDSTSFRCGFLDTGFHDAHKIHVG